MIIKNKRLLKVISYILVFALTVTTLIPANIAYASEAVTDQTETEWYNFRNNQENNGVTDRETPIELNETTLKWAHKYGTGYAAAPTPPVIVGGKLYIAMSNVVVEIEKETGEILRQSTPMAANVGYATNPPLYADGKLFVQIGNGMIQAVDIETMKAVWHTEKIGGQTISPISYTKVGKAGYIYLGTWTGESKDGVLICATTDNSNVKDGVKELAWKFMPSGNTTDETVKFDQALKETLDDENTVAKRGFYWAGAYANEKYIAIGSDDGTKEGDYSANAVFYTLNPVTGDIIDRIDNIKGDIRTTVVYDNGYLYFSTKGGHCYKVAVDNEGNLGEYSYIDLGGMTTASPVVYKNKIYIGVCGQGGQFDADGGHGFAVIDNSKAELTADSLMYKIPIKGYPQAAALVSTAYADKDFDKDGKADGRVYIYFTYNANPGGIYYTYDTADQKDASPMSQELFVPPTALQQYCISTICTDAEGTLYYKNDSCNLMAVEKNYAYLESLEVTADDNSDIIWDKDFETGFGEYNLVVKNSAKKLTLEATAVDGADSLYYDDKEIDMTDKVSLSTSVIVEKNGKTRVYKLNIRKEGTDSALSELYVSNSNTYGSGRLSLTEEFQYDKYDYVQDVTSLNKTFFNVWPTAADTEATVIVYAGENVADKKGNTIAQGTEISHTSIANNHKRYAIYPEDTAKTASVKVEVTSEDGTETSTYTLKLMKKYYFNQVTVENQDFTGTEIKAPVTVTNGLGEKLIEGTDYALSYNNNTAVGTAEVIVTGAGNYAGQTATENFEICQPTIADIQTEEQLYTGKALTPAFVVVSQSGQVVPPSEYTMTYENNTEVGTATVTVTPAEGSSYTGEVTENFTIRKTNIDKINLKNGEIYAYTGSEIKPAITVYDEMGKTVSTKNYEITYENNTEVGKGTIKVTAVSSSNYQGTSTVEFNILEGEITYYKVNEQAYTGDPVSPQIIVLDNNRKAVPKSAYSIEFTNNTDIGTANFTVKAKEGKGYFGEISGSFEISKARLSKIEVEDQKYAKKALKPHVKIYDNFGKVVDPANYEVSYMNNVEPGQAKVIVKAKEESVYRGTLYGNFFITKTKVVSAIVSNQIYTGKAVKPAVTVKDEFAMTVPATEYAVTYKNNEKVGTATVTVAMNNDSIYSGSIKTSFVILPKAPATATAEIDSSSQTGGYDDVKFTWAKSEGASGYLVYYKKATASKWSNPIATTKTSYLKKNLTDGVKYNFKVVPYFKDTNENKMYSAKEYTSASVYTLKATAIPTVTKSGLKVKVKWNDINGETGYQISKSTKKTGTNIVVKNVKGTYKIVSAKKGQKYYYKVRAYKTVNGKKVFAPWSKVKAYTR